MLKKNCFQLRVFVYLEYLITAFYGKEKKQVIFSNLAILQQEMLFESRNLQFPGKKENGNIVRGNLRLFPFFNVALHSRNPRISRIILKIANRVKMILCLRKRHCESRHLETHSPPSCAPCLYKSPPSSSKKEEKQFI